MYIWVKGKRWMFIPLSWAQMRSLRRSISLTLFVLIRLPVLCGNGDAADVAERKCCFSNLGMDLSFIVDLSFVGKLMRLCPLTHKSPSPAVLHYEPQGSTNPSNRIGGTIAPFFLTSHLCSWLFSSARVFIAHGFQPPCVF